MSCGLPDWRDRVPYCGGARCPHYEAEPDACGATGVRLHGRGSVCLPRVREMASRLGEGAEIDTSHCLIGPAPAR